MRRRLVQGLSVTAMLALQFGCHKTPDISGTWMLMDYSTRLDENPPFQPWAAEQFRKVEAGEAEDLGAKCLPPGVPRIMKAPYPLEIFERPGRVDILHEYMHLVRRIYTDGRAHAKNQGVTWMGRSTGRWDGDTLVVDTTGLDARTWLDPAGDPHSDALHVTERLRRTNPNTLEDRITIDDPKAYTKAWTATLTYERKPDWDIYEYICEENNRSAP